MKFRTALLQHQSTISALSVVHPLSKPRNSSTSLSFPSDRTAPSTSSFATVQRNLTPTVSASSSSIDSRHSQESHLKSRDGDPEKVEFHTLGSCKLCISWYPDFEYDARGGSGTATPRKKDACGDRIWVSFDPRTLRIPSLMSATTRFLGLPLPPFLKIDVLPELLQGTIDEQTGQVDLEFKARFLFSAADVYKAPPLLVATVLTSEESKGGMKSGRGRRMSSDGSCRLVGVATVDPVDDAFINSFLGLPTECLADLDARISISRSSS